MFFKTKEKINLDQLRGIFDAQKQTLIRKGYQEIFGKEIFKKEIENTWNRLQENSEKISFIKKGNVPLLLVVNFSDVKKGVEKIQGHTELDLYNIKPEKSEQAFCILLDVEDGQNMVAKSPKDALKKFEKERRFALNLNESIALLTHYPKLLENHYLISAGSFYTKPFNTALGEENEVLPLLWLLDEHSNPELHYAWFHIAHGSYGTASYAIKI